MDISSVWFVIKDLIVYVDSFVSLQFSAWLFMCAKIFFSIPKFRKYFSTLGKRVIVTVIALLLALIFDTHLLIITGWSARFEDQIERQFTAFLFTLAFYDLVKFLYKILTKKLKNKIKEV